MHLGIYCAASATATAVATPGASRITELLFYYSNLFRILFIHFLNWQLCLQCAVRRRLPFVVWTPPSPLLAEYWLRVGERDWNCERGASSGVDGNSDRDGVAYSSMRIFTKQHVMAHTAIGAQRERERQCKNLLREQTESGRQRER